MRIPTSFSSLRSSLCAALVVVGACSTSSDTELPAGELVGVVAEQPVERGGTIGFNRGCKPVGDLTCDPRSNTSCDPGEGCYLVSDTELTCAPEFPGDFGDACDYLNQCDEGLTCLSTFAFDNCDNDVGCCSSFCELDDPFSCPRHFECVEILTHAPRCFENLGVCVSA